MDKINVSPLASRSKLGDRVAQRARAEESKGEQATRETELEEKQN